MYIHETRSLCRPVSVFPRTRGSAVFDYSGGGRRVGGDSDISHGSINLPWEKIYEIRSNRLNIERDLRVFNIIIIITIVVRRDKLCYSCKAGVIRDDVIAQILKHFTENEIVSLIRTYNGNDNFRRLYWCFCLTGLFYDVIKTSYIIIVFYIFIFTLYYSILL